MRKFLFGLMTVLLVVVLAACSSEDKKNDEKSSAKKDQTITFGVTPWTSTVPPTKIARLILEDMGYKVKETNADVSSIYIGLSRGDINVYMDSWMPSHEVHLEKYKGKVEDTAISFSGAASGLVVPTYMEDINSIEDLKGKEDLFNNEIYGVEAGGNAAKIIDSLIEGYGLDMKQVNSSEGGMIAQGRRQIEQKKPVVFYGWRPHTMFNKMDIKVIEDPKGYFSIPDIHVITNAGLKEEAPEAYEFLSNWSIDIDDLEAMIVAIEDGAEPEDVAREWIDNNQDKVNEMIGK
ncbi:glycine betaine ABC transporter substrate-binding protein [Sporosarcina jiandibaonis]|uniref:glycine betaine ABC transporter substrate-binding protein n=1 Tax=Sporosarcina jiandibaonis TaxID=2715535 RepID=UPI0015575BF7|nr:glycine betaine ABC transporter substrate-binding protein [Sporosarcina jiandibaonis]